MKLGTRLLVILAILAMGGFLYWFFIGGALFTKNVQDIMPAPAAGEEMVVLKQGMFRDADSFHRGSGTAKVVQMGGKYFLVLEDFKVTNGPDLFVYLSKSSDVAGEEALGEHKVLARLKGNEGNQVYELTKEDAEQFSSAVIWCKRFGVLFSSAPFR